MSGYMTNIEPDVNSWYTYIEARAQAREAGIRYVPPKSQPATSAKGAEMNDATQQSKDDPEQADASPAQQTGHIGAAPGEQEAASGRLLNPKARMCNFEDCFSTCVRR